MNITGFLTSDGFLMRDQKNTEENISTFSEHFSHLFSSDDPTPQLGKDVPLAEHDSGVLEKEEIFEFLSELADDESTAIFDDLEPDQVIAKNLSNTSMSDTTNEKSLAMPLLPPEKNVRAPSQKFVKTSTELDLTTQLIAGSFEKPEQTKAQTHIALNDDKRGSVVTPDNKMNTKLVQNPLLELGHQPVGFDNSKINSDDPSTNIYKIQPLLSHAKPPAQFAKGTLPTEMRPVALDQRSNKSHPISVHNKADTDEFLPLFDPIPKAKSTNPEVDFAISHKPIQGKNLERGEQTEKFGKTAALPSNVQIDLPKSGIDRPNDQVSLNASIPPKDSPNQSVNPSAANPPLERQFLANPSNPEPLQTKGLVSQEIELVTRSDAAPKGQKDLTRTVHTDHIANSNIAPLGTENFNRGEGAHPIVNSVFRTEHRPANSISAVKKKIAPIVAKSQEPQTQIAQQFLNNAVTAGSIIPIDLNNPTDTQINVAPQFDSSPVLASKGLVMDKPPHPIAQQIASHLFAQVASKEQGNFGITLSPKELGRVEFSFQSLDKSGLAITILAERDETAALVKRHLDVLTKDLERLGYSEICFSCQGQSGQKEAKESPLNWEKETPEEDEHVAQSQKAGVSTPSYGLSTALDIRL